MTHVYALKAEPEKLKMYLAWLTDHPHRSLWQSLEWEKYQQSLGRETRIYVYGEKEIRASALVTIDRTKGGHSTWEIARGPLWDETFTKDDISAFFMHLQTDAKADKCLALFLSSPVENVFPDASPSKRHVHPEATRIVDLTKTEEEILAQMKPKGRYNIGVAQKHKVDVRESDDIDAYCALAKETGGRDGFKIHPKSHYEKFLKNLSGSFLLLAYGSQLTAHSSKKPIAGLLGVRWGDGAIYYYGASSYAHRALMAPYLLQWEAMRLCKAQGCRSYDLLGVAPADAPFGHPWSGISSFKEKFGGALVTYPAEQVVVMRPIPWKALMMKRKIFG